MNDGYIQNEARRAAISNLYRFRFNSDLCRDIEEVLSLYAGKISVAEAVGSLEMSKLCLIRYEEERLGMATEE